MPALKMADLPSTVVHRLRDDHEPAHRARSLPVRSPNVQRLLDLLDEVETATAPNLALWAGLDAQYVQAALFSLAERGLVRRVDREGAGVKRRALLRWERVR
jgi:predicted transcriptional regulator